MGTLAQGLVSLAGRGGGSVGGITAAAAAAAAALTGGARKAGAEPFTKAANMGIKPINKKCISSKKSIKGDMLKEHSC